MHSPSTDDQGQRSMRSRTVHAGEAPTPGAHPLADPIHQGAVYAFADSGQADATFAEGGLLYARDGLPNHAIAVVPHRNSTIRLSVGLEDPAAIISDLEQALAAVLQPTLLEEM